MKTKLYLFYLAVISSMVLLYGCDVVTCVEPNIPAKNYAQFNGEWQWIRTYDGWAGIQTPATKGYSETIVFGTDNRYRKLRNNLLIEEYPYYITKEKSTYSGQDSVFVFYEQKSGFGHPLYLISKDTLHTRMSEGCNDCPEEYYVRKKVSENN